MESNNFRRQSCCAPSFASGRPTWHPGIPILREAGAIIDEDTVHPAVAQWLEILGAPDIALSVDVRRPGGRMPSTRDRTTRRGKHAAISRGGVDNADSITIEEVASVPSLKVLFERIMQLCDRGFGPVEPAVFAPITVRTAALFGWFQRDRAWDRHPSSPLRWRR